MSSIKKHKHPQWHLVTAVSISLITLLTLLHNSIISAAANGTAVNLQNLAAPSHTILVGMAAETAGPAKAASSSDEIASLAAIAPDAVQAELLVPFEEVTANKSPQLGQIYKVHLRSDNDIAAVIRQLEANPAVLFAEPDYLAHLIATPNDSHYNDQWGLAQINAPTAWDVTTGSSNVVIAVIDSGMDTTHPDLAGQLWTNPGEIAGNGLDDDNNGYIDDVHGWNMVDDNANLSDNTGHGTEVAGVIGAASNNGQGIAGVCWNCRLMVLKVTQSGGIANYSDIIEAIQYATLKGADVVNLSLGGNSDSISLKLAVEQAAATAVVVGGAGNDDSDVPFYPAAYESVLAVAGTSASDTKVSSSNYGPWIDVTAPGETIMTTFDGGSYGMSSGTSMAAPFAAGLAGLLRSAHPDWSADTARAQIMQTATAVDTVNPGLEGLLGDGRIDAAQALTIAAQPALGYASHEVDGVVNGRPEPGSTFDLNVALANDWADASNVQATLSSADSYITIVENSASYGDIDTFNQAANLTPFRITVSGSAPYAQELALTLNVTADGGYGTAVPITITTASSTEYVSGLITADTIWNNNKQYIMTGNILVQAGVTLTIEAGTTIKVAPSYVLRVNGSLVTYGTEAEPVLFTSNNTEPAHSDWIGIEINDEGEGNLSYCEISYAETAVKLLGNNPKATINHCYIHHNRDGIQGADFRTLLIAENYIAHNYVRGILFPGTDAEIYRNEIAYNGGDGIHASAMGNVGLVTENLIHHNGTSNWDSGYGIFSGPGTIISNTIVYNKLGAGFEDPSNTVFRNNNVWGNTIYDMKNSYVGGQPFDATNNWWGTTDTSLIDQHIYDFLDDLDRAITNYTPILTEPEPTAPRYLNNLEISPESPIGIETAIFNLQFSGPMDQSVNPTVTFYNSRYNTWDIHQPYDMINEIAIDSNNWKWVATEGYGVAYFDGTAWAYYTPYNSGLPGHYIGSLAIADDGSKWFGTSDSGLAHLNNATWTIYNTSNSSLPSNNVIAIAFENDGTKWIGTTNGLARFNNSGWTVFNTTNSPLPNNMVVSIAIDNDGTKWIGTLGGGLAKLSGTTWTIYNSANSGLPNNWVYAITGDDVKWIGTGGGGTARLENGIWTVYDTSNSNLPNNNVYAIYLNTDGSIWFGTSGGAASLKNETWTIYNTSNSSLPSNEVRSIVVDEIYKTTWFGTTTNAYSGGIGVLYGGEVYTVSENARWIDSSNWQGRFDITSLIPRSEYVINVHDAQGTDGLEIMVDSRFSFTVDYAGEITDQTAPEPPLALAGGLAGDTSGVEAVWFANTIDSSIVGYRYGLGSAPGATDIINWTTTSETSLQLHGLGLVEGQRYWLAVQARNAGGLWSTSAYSGFIAGQPLGRVFLPTVLKP